MTGVLLATRAGDESQATRVPIELRIEDSLTSIAMPIRGVSAIMVAVLVGSLAIHVVLVVAAIVAERMPKAPQQQEIAVEVVQEPLKPVPPLPQTRQQAKHEQAKPQSEPKPKPEPAKPIPPTPQVAKVDPPKPLPATPKTQAATPAPDPREIAALQKELADLRAQQAVLKAERAPQQIEPGEMRGPLAGSMQAIALPSSGEGDIVGYQDVVFSQLAKAKGDGEYHGEAGTTGVHFEVDAEGRLLRAEVAASSGSATLDTRALDIVRRAAPFPPPPKDADHSFFANVNFTPSKP